MDAEDRSIVRRTITPESVSRPLVAPISPSVVYRSSDANELDDQYDGLIAGYTYAREGHPNATILAEKLAWMEGVQNGIVTSSGMAALTAVLLGLLGAGDHIVAGNQLYGRSLRLMTQDLPRLGFDISLVDACDRQAVAAAVRPNTRLMVAEVVSNPTLRVADIDGLNEIAKNKDILFVVDNTFTTPRAFRPFDHGADIVMHSVTKLLAGHSDVTLGFVAARTEAHHMALNDAAITWGLNSSPFDCWLAERGLNTFELRFDRAQANAAELADYLKGLQGVARVLYPGQKTHPNHALASRLLAGNFANMVSFELEGGRREVNRFLRSAKNIAFAPTLGDVATTISHPASSSHRGLGEQDRLALGISEGFIRVSVGVEDIALLKQEFGTAVAAIQDADDR